MEVKPEYAMTRDTAHRLLIPRASRKRVASGVRAWFASVEDVMKSRRAVGSIGCATLLSFLVFLTHGARAGASQEAQRRQSTETAIADGWITTKVKALFVPEAVLDGGDIRVETSAAVVTLSGTVPSEAARQKATALARTVENVRSVVDRLQIAAGDVAHGEADSGHGLTSDTGESSPPESVTPLTGEVNRATEQPPDIDPPRDRQAPDPIGDGWLVAKVKSQFIGVDVLSGSRVDVETTGGVITLRGVVPSSRARSRAESIARGVRGVRAVRNELRISDGNP
jgi:osmotically-inducible protein OsmY